MDSYQSAIDHTEVKPIRWNRMQFFSKQRLLPYYYMDAPRRHCLSHIDEKLNSNCKRMLWTVMNKSWKQHPTKQQLYGQQPPISKTIQIRWTRHARHCRRSKDKLISYVLLWIPSHGQVRVGWPARNYLQRLCTDTGCSIEDPPRVMDHRDKW